MYTSSLSNFHFKRLGVLREENYEHCLRNAKRTFGERMLRISLVFSSSKCAGMNQFDFLGSIRHRKTTLSFPTSHHNDPGKA